ncbi:hypothetical protein PIB30_067635 [Stylosanthes scabra]|uniref:Uncharacterized protein n=1 Tax=Stylosanthes scabra TaxID=79078 RepID=A0ABU6XLK9_9FABA|nr:hypothetical protein [Stylosanthes scabra]
MEAALRELLGRQTREAVIASEAMTRAEAMVARQQALLEEAEKREQELKEKLQHKPSVIDDDDITVELRDRTWKPSTVIQEEGQTAVKTDWDKKETSRRDPPREDRGRREQRSGRTYYIPLNVSLTTFLNEVSQVERIPALHAIENAHRGDRNAYCKYHKQTGHHTEDCHDVLDFVKQGLKKGKFREYTSRSGTRNDDRRTRQRMDSPDRKSNDKKEDWKEGVTRRVIKMISGGLPEEGNPPSWKAAKRSWNSCLAVEVMPRALADKIPPEITFSREEIKRTTDTMNRPLINYHLYGYQGNSADILFRRCFDVLGLTEKDLEAHSDDLVGIRGKCNPRWLRNTLGYSQESTMHKERESEVAGCEPQFGLQCNYGKANPQLNWSSHCYFNLNHEVHNGRRKSGSASMRQRRSRKMPQRHIAHIQGINLEARKARNS